MRLCVVYGFVVVWSFLASAAWAQSGERLTVRWVRPFAGVRALQAEGAVRNPAAPHYDVVALRIEFQPDTTRFTTGDGTFDSALYGGLDSKVDPLPHDAAYFHAHLSFLEDYVARVSDGQTRISTHLIPEVVRVSQPMGAYSPTGPESSRDEEMRKLASLVDEAWTLADAQSSMDLSGFDPERTAFIIFHAGVGRDIELVGTTLDKTPQDLPSLFFGAETLDRLLPGRDASFKGVPIDHSLLIPRTETRLGTDFLTDQPFLAELSINGLLAASFFNYLGVPDLFNTETGESAIGPFGLMDPLGIFAYSGLFPPEPSAWTKYYLGWMDPVELRGGASQTVSLDAAGLLDVQGDAVEAARAWISGAEYFLVENRHRDPEGDGLVLRVFQNGQVVEQRAVNGEEGFNGSDISGFVGGVVVGVDHYDWALPGGLDEEGQPLNGGMLIWHVNERRLLDFMAENRVNADPERRAVDLEEADSGQDLGFPSSDPFGPGYDLGSPFDFFYEGNPVRVETAGGREIRLYENRFGPDTFPSSEASDGGPSFVVLENFSLPGAEMSFVYRREGEAGVQPVDLFSDIDLAGGNVTFGRDAYLSLIPNDRGFDVLAYSQDCSSGEAVNVACLVWGDPESEPLSRSYVATLGLSTTILPDGQAVRVSKTGDGAAVERFRGGRWEHVANLTIPSSAHVQSPAVAVGTSDLLIGVSDQDTGAADVLRLYGDGYDTTAPAATDVLTWASDGQRLIYAGRNRAAVEQGVEASWDYHIDAGAEVGQVVFGRDGSGLIGAVPVLDEDRLLLLLADGDVRSIEVGSLLDPARDDSVSDELSAYPVLADLDGDRRLDVLTTYGARLVGITQGGAVVAGFPITLSTPSVAQPLVAELTDSGGWSILVASTDGNVYAYDLGRAGAMVPGFPLSAGFSLKATPLLHGQRLYTISEEGKLSAWQLENLGEVWWGQLYGGAQHLSYVELAESPPSPGNGDPLLDTRETYNWPNPIEDGSTHLRFKLTRDGRVRITVVDLAGRLVDEITVEDVKGGTPTEHVWFTTAPSGVYYARVEAESSDGARQVYLFKMAVVR